LFGVPFTRPPVFGKPFGRGTVIYSVYLPFLFLRTCHSDMSNARSPAPGMWLRAVSLPSVQRRSNGCGGRLPPITKPTGFPGLAVGLLPDGVGNSQCKSAVSLATAATIEIGTARSDFAAAASKLSRSTKLSDTAVDIIPLGPIAIVTCAQS